MRIAGYKFDGKWRPDGQDEQNFDCAVIRASIRYYAKDNRAKPAIYVGNTLLMESLDYIQGSDEKNTKELAEGWIRSKLYYALQTLQRTQGADWGDDYEW